MANTITGRVFVIEDAVTIPSKTGGNAFVKRSLVLDCSRFDQFTGQQYENYPQIEFVGNNVTLLDGFKTGDLVTVTFSLAGRKTVKDGNTRFYTNITGYKIEPFISQNAHETSVVSQSQQTTTAEQPAPSSQADKDLPF